MSDSSTERGAPSQASAETPRTAREVSDRGRLFLENKGVEEARLDAELLVAHALGMDRLGLFMTLDRPVAEEELRRARELLVRRGKGEPVAYLTGEREFFGRAFHVGAGCLIPRPETEHLIDEARRWWQERTGSSAVQRDLALEASRQRALAADHLSEQPDADTEAVEAMSKEAPTPPAQSGPVVLDLGTGSGCLAITLALELEGASVTAVERSAAALEWARANARALGAEVCFEEGDALAFLGGLSAGSLDLVVSNPPYVDRKELPNLAREVRDFEPAEALLAPQGDVDFWVRELVQRVPALLRAGGLLLIELGAEQGERALALARAAAPCGARVEVLRDLAGLDRVLVLGA